MRDVVSKELLWELKKAKRVNGEGYIIIFLSALTFTLCYSTLPLLYGLWLAVIIGLLVAVATFCTTTLFFRVWLVKQRTYRALLILQPTTKDIEKLLSTGPLFSVEQRFAFDKYLNTLYC